MDDRMTYIDAANKLVRCVAQGGIPDSLQTEWYEGREDDAKEIIVWHATHAHARRFALGLLLLGLLMDALITAYMAYLGSGFWLTAAVTAFALAFSTLAAAAARTDALKPVRDFNQHEPGMRIKSFLKRVDEARVSKGVPPSF